MFNSLCLCVRFNMIKSKLVDLIRALVSICRLDRAEDSKYRQNFLTFGVGPHMCVGREYAINHFIAFLSVLSTSADWERRITPESDKIKFLPTIYQADCLVTMAPRKVRLIRDYGRLLTPQPPSSFLCATT